jgi:hypothetical protein
MTDGHTLPRRLGGHTKMITDYLSTGDKVLQRGQPSRELTMTRLRSRIETLNLGIRLMISSTSGRIAMVAVSVLALALGVGLFTPARASSKAPTALSDPVANSQLSQMANGGLLRRPSLRPLRFLPCRHCRR